MLRSFGKKLWCEESGAIASVYALALPALIAVGGIAFDYARLAAMDTELQNAADQAALAAASQLDGGSDAITRATNAANAMVVNKTLFANDSNASGKNVTVPTLVFYTSYNATTDAPGSTTTSGSAAKVVQVTVANRTAQFALTPVVAALRSATINASAVAGMGSGICQVPPLMFCAPSANFPSATDIGIGVRLQPGPTTGAWAPGDYGYLDFGNGASGLATNLGSNQATQACFDNSSGIETEPGNKASVTTALNTRLDLYEPSAGSCDIGTGNFCPAQNTRKDFARKEIVTISNLAYQESNLAYTDPPQQSFWDANPNPGCGAAGATVTDFEQRATAVGFTRDSCHITGTCTTNFGNGTWDVGGYFAANHPSAAVPTGSAATRYSVYKWELADPANRMGAKRAETEQSYKITGNNNGRKIDLTYTNYCAYPTPKNATGVASSSTQKDRRILTVASVDCTGLNGKGTVRVLQWVDVFLVEPSADRSAPYSTGKSQIYGEIIGVATKPDGGSAFQFYSRNRPYLIK